MWPEFIPIETRGMSVITALFILGLIIAWAYLNARVSNLKDCVDSSRELLTKIKVDIAELNAYSKVHWEDIREIKELIRRK